MTRLLAALQKEYRRVVPAGYSLSDLTTDLSAGLTVSVVALPLGLVVAIAAGASPDKGLVGIIIGGAVIALFTASRFQIGGPTEACILIAVVVIEMFGYEGLLAATLLAGVFLLGMAIARVGILIEAM
ncbi:MAG: SulP family inorganic anion transporter, partial [Acidobacteria bacterium]|nr:SulP family inorganic anion transporter [Acidobacteriota bacterium]